MKVLSSILLLAIAFTSCDETKKVIDVAGNVQLAGNYSVKNINGQKATPDNLTLVFAALDKSVSGQAGCNSFFGNYTLDLYALTFGDFAVTEKYCDEKTMVFERAFLDALRETGSYSLENNQLTLYSKTDRSVLLTASKN